jgi:hypothetical protein
MAGEGKVEGEEDEVADDGSSSCRAEWAVPGEATPLELGRFEARGTRWHFSSIKTQIARNSKSGLSKLNPTIS